MARVRQVITGLAKHPNAMYPDVGGKKVFLEFNPVDPLPDTDPRRKFVGNRGLLIGVAGQNLLTVHVADSAHPSTGSHLTARFSDFLEPEPQMLDARPQFFGAILIYDPPDQDHLTEEEYACLGEFCDYDHDSGKDNGGIGVTFMLRQPDGQRRMVQLTRPFTHFKWIARGGIHNWLEVPYGL